MRGLALLWLCWLGAGCAPRSGGSVAVATEHAAPQLQRFAAFDRWARRAASAGGARGRGEDGFAEAVFAPIRHQPFVLGAWVQLEGARGRTVALPAGAAPPDAPAWVALRDPALGVLRVATQQPCALAPRSRARVRRSRRPEPDPPACVLISRRAPAVPRAITVTVAFREPAASLLGRND
jgi:hypothetical protein